MRYNFSLSSQTAGQNKLERLRSARFFQVSLIYDGITIMRKAQKELASEKRSSLFWSGISYIGSDISIKSLKRKT
jgi:hypothetical protein